MTGKPKRGLADFLSQEFKSSHDDQSSEVPKSQTPKVQTLEVPKSRTSEVTSSRTDGARSRAAPPEEASSEEPLYLRLTRKEVRFRDAQLESLYAVARRLSRARRGAKGDAKADRITENTLVRVAVDLLLQHGDELAGHDEPSLLESLRRLSRKKG